MPILTTFRMRLPVCPASGRRGRAPKNRPSWRAPPEPPARHSCHPPRWRLPWRAKGHVQGGPVFGLVDLLAPEHGVDAGAQARLLRETGQQIQRFAGDTVLRVVQEDANGLGGQPPPAFRIVREVGRAKTRRAFRLMIFQGLPCRGLASRAYSRCVCIPVSPISPVRSQTPLYFARVG